jgi:hypothetical protein
MTFDDSYLHSSKRDIVDNLFTRTADENYITARWCAMNRLQTDFFWLGAHALEKYMKAVLLVNERPVKEYGHKILELHAEIIKFAADLLPSHLTKPTEWPYDDWLVRPLQGFLEHLYDYGQPDNRYLVFGYSFRSEDLFMLDQAVFAYRRLICRLDASVIPAHHLNAPAWTNREMLKDSPKYFSYIGSSMPLCQLLKSKEKSSLRDIALNLNFCFAPSDYVHSSIEVISSTRTPVLLYQVFDHLRSDGIKTAKLGIELAEWTIKNIKMPPNIREELMSAKEATKKRLKNIDIK